MILDFSFFTILFNFMTGFCRFFKDSLIPLHNALPTTKPSAFLKDDIVFSVIPKPITAFFVLLNLLILK